MTTASAGPLSPPDARAGFDAPPPGEAQIELINSESPNLATFEDPCVSLFCVAQDTPPERLRELLAAAWNLDPATTLKLICNLRGVRGTGKGDRECFYTAALWLHTNHPKSLALNLSAFANFDYIIKDFPEILYRLTHGADARKVASLTRLAGRKRGRSPDSARASSSAFPPEPRLALADVVPGVLPVAAELEQPEDDAYRFLFARIVEFFANQLKADLDQLDSGKPGKIGLAAKWCPSEQSPYNRKLKLCEAIARRLFPHESMQPTYRVLRRFRKEVLVRLRAALELPEIYVSAKRWSQVPYNRVASVAMKKYAHSFEKHDKDRFLNFRSEANSRKPKVISKLRTDDGIPLPHDLAPYLEPEAKASTARKNQARQHWVSLVNNLREKGMFRNCLAICDVLGCDRALELRVCVGLNALISELSEDPWADFVHAFSETSRPCLLPSDIGGKVEFLRNKMKDNCTKRFNLKLVYDWIRSIGSAEEVTSENMVKTIFVFTVKDFEEATLLPWAADYRAVRDTFHQAGYRDVVPQVVVWNLKGRRSPVLTSMEDGVMNISGLSGELMKLFLDKGGIVEPEDEMYAAIAGDEYKQLVAID